MTHPPDPKTTAADAVSPRMQAALAALCLEVLPIWARQLATAREQSEAAVNKMLAAFSSLVPQLGNTADLPPDEATAKNENLEQMYVGFQYQDRVNQIMALLQDDMARLHGMLENPSQDSEALAVNTWLERLESLYAMAEQRRDHGADGQSSDPAADNETSFF